MPIKDFKESEIRKNIIKKVKPKVSRSRSPHQKGKIFVDDKLVARVKIPNDHQKIMRKSKSQYIAASLKLTDNEFNDLINCPLSGPGYYEILKDKISI
jgi:hypothetical protein